MGIYWIKKTKKHQTNLQFSKPSQVAKGCETNRKDHVGSALESVAQEHVLNSNHLRFSHVKQPFPIHTMTRSKLNHTTLHLILIKLNAHELQGETGFSTPKNVIKCGIYEHLICNKSVNNKQQVYTFVAHITNIAVIWDGVLFLFCQTCGCN